MCAKRDAEAAPEKAITLFVSDIDGCLAMPYAPFDLDALRKLRQYAVSAQERRDPALPAFSICSGRSYSYVEAMTQLLGIGIPVMFEAGGGMFDPVAARRLWSPAFTTELAESLEAVRAHLDETYCEPGVRWLDSEKRTQAGLVTNDAAWIRAAMPDIAAWLAEYFPELYVAYTDVSIDVLGRTLTKKQGVRWLAEERGVGIDAVAFIGDTMGDVGAIEDVGVGFAPSNAKDEAITAADRVTKSSYAQGVLEAYEWCVQHNTMLRAE